MRDCFQSGLSGTPRSEPGTLRAGLTPVLASVLVMGLLSGCVGTDETQEM